MRSYRSRPSTPAWFTLRYSSSPRHALRPLTFGRLRYSSPASARSRPGTAQPRWPTSMDSWWSFSRPGAHRLSAPRLPCGRVTVIFSTLRSVALLQQPLALNQPSFWKSLESICTTLVVPTRIGCKFNLAVSWPITPARARQPFSWRPFPPLASLSASRKLLRDFHSFSAYILALSPSHQACGTGIRPKGFSPRYFWRPRAFF